MEAGIWYGQKCVDIKIKQKLNSNILANSKLFVATASDTFVMNWNGDSEP